MNRAHVLRAARERRQRPKYPLWLSMSPTRPVGRRDRQSAANWNDVKAVAAAILFVLLVYAMTQAMPHPESKRPADPRGFVVEVGP